MSEQEILDELKRKDNRIAELEAHNLGLTRTLVELERELAIRDLEQQAKGIEDALSDYNVALELLAGDKYYKKALTNRATQLREQAKQLKEKNSE